jgi:hypothetical protein
VEIYGRKGTLRDLEARVGRIEQIAGLRRLRWVDGFESDVEQIQVRTGAGLSYYISPSRGMDISLAEFGGVPLSWQSSAGDAHPAYYDSRGAEWLRTAAGGLLMTCGLSYVGAPGEDQGKPYGLHGRIHHSPARQVSLLTGGGKKGYDMTVRGIVEETATFGESLRLERWIHSELGSNKIRITDRVENFGFEPAPHMILYHFNFGFPLMSEETTIFFPSGRVVPRDAGTPVEDYDKWQRPKAGYQERVYYHEDLMHPYARVTITNPHFPRAGGGFVELSVRLNWSTVELPKLVQWKMPGAGVHVLGIEPANCYVEGRAAERQRGTLQFLEPGESRSYDLALEISTGPDAAGQGSDR